MKDKALHIEEPPLFDRPASGSGVDFEKPPAALCRLGPHARTSPPPLPGLSEPEAVRHFVRLSQKNYSIDTGIFPLGSCTMKHNPRLNEKIARLPGFASIHPLQPISTVQGALALMHRLGGALMALTGCPAITLNPRAGAQGELCGLMAISAALQARGEAAKRRRVLVPESAHGTNPSTAALAGYTSETIPSAPDGRLDLAAFKARLGDDVAALMLTNPNTCGLFERDIIAISRALRQAGAFFYCDGANFNAIAGRVDVGALGVDAMHINLHKTFSTPHGGGGPGAGPVVFSAALAPFAPLPQLRQIKGENRFILIENSSEAEHYGLYPCGRLAGFHGQMGMFVRALAYILSQGGEGVRQAAEDAVLAANYIFAGVKDLMSSPFNPPFMHEILLDEKFLNGSDISTLDFAKAMIDEGVHPMTVYFPLNVKGAMLIEPTETESKESLDQFIALLRRLALAAKQGSAQRFHDAPITAPRRRLDEALAARKPILVHGD